MSVIKTIKGVITGVNNYIFPKEEVEIIARERLKICSECSLMSRTKNVIGIQSMYCDSDKGAIFNIDGEEVFVQGCGCSLFAKARNLTDNCPAKKWPSINIELERIEEKEVVVKDSEGNDIVIKV